MKKTLTRYTTLTATCTLLGTPLTLKHPLGIEAAYAEESTTAPRSMGDKIEDSTESAVISTQKAFFEAIDKKSLSFSYHKGKSDVSSSEKRSLRALVGAQGNLRETAYIAAWADRNLEKTPSANAQSAAEALAKRRLAGVESSLRASGFSGKVVLLNMVSRPSLLAKDLGIESEEVKSATREPSDETTVRHQKIADLLTSKGGLQKSVVVLVEDK